MSCVDNADGTRIVRSQRLEELFQVRLLAIFELEAKKAIVVSDHRGVISEAAVVVEPALLAREKALERRGPVAPVR